jgi:hypothetical protein
MEHCRFLCTAYPADSACRHCHAGGDDWDGVAFFAGAEWQELGRHVGAGVGFFANILLYTDVNYFNADITYKPLLHLWSLGVEEQFYIGWPIALVVAYRQRRNIGYLMVGIVLLSFISNIMLVARDPDAAFYLPFTRIWELAIGGLLALRALTPHTPFTTNQKHTLSVLGVIAIIASCWFFDKFCFQRLRCTIYIFRFIAITGIDYDFVMAYIRGQFFYSGIRIIVYKNNLLSVDFKLIHTHIQTAHSRSVLVYLAFFQTDIHRQLHSHLRKKYLHSQFRAKFRSQTT